MTDQIKITQTITATYTPNPEAYPDCETVEEMAAFDEENFRDYPEMFIGIADDVSVTAEVVPEDPA